MTDEAKEPTPEGWRPGDGAKASWEAAKNNPGHAVVGGVIGQILIPIPVVGFVVGGAIGSWIAKKNDPEQNKK
jgi:phage tail tape-measure protein